MHRQGGDFGEFRAQSRHPEPRKPESGSGESPALDSSIEQTMGQVGRPAQE